MNPSFEEMRGAMVDIQLVARGISDKRVLEAFRKVPRHEFVPEEERQDSYSDYPLPVGYGQTISQPYMVALMTQCLDLKPDYKVLEVGTGSGYQTAILAELAREVYSIERIEGLSQKAARTLERLGYRNCFIKAGDGTLGWGENAPYDSIMVTAGAPDITASLIDQLKDKGILVIPVGGSLSQVLKIAVKDGNSIRESEICACVYVPLIGKEGWAG